MRSSLLVLSCLVLAAGAAPAQEATTTDLPPYWEHLFTMPRLGEWSSARSFTGPIHPYPEFVTAPTPAVAEQRFLIWRPGDDAGNRSYTHWSRFDEGVTVHRKVLVLVLKGAVLDKGKVKFREKEISLEALEKAKTAADAAAVLGGVEPREAKLVLAGKTADEVTVRHEPGGRVETLPNLEKTWKPFELVKREDFKPTRAAPTWRATHVRKAKAGGASVQVQINRSAKEIFWVKAWVRGGDYDNEYSGGSLIGGEEITASDKTTGSRVASTRYFNKKGAPSMVTLDFGRKHRVSWLKRPGNPVLEIGGEKVETTLDELKFQEAKGKTTYLVWWSPKVPGAIARSFSVEERKGKVRLRLTYVTKIGKKE